MKKILSIIIIISLHSCYIYDNSCDPEAKSYIGYNTVSNINDIKTVKNINDQAVLISTKYHKVITYEYQVKEVEVSSWDNIKIFTSKSNIINASELNLEVNKSYHWRVRGSLSESNKGSWSAPREITSAINITTNYDERFVELYYSDFLYIVLDSQNNNSGYQIRYSINNGNYLLDEYSSNEILISEIKSNSIIKYQVRAKKGEYRGFWSDLRSLEINPLLINLRAIDSKGKTFTLGKSNTEIDTPDREITWNYNYQIGSYEITNELFCSVINSSFDQIEIQNNKLYFNEKLILNLEDNFLNLESSLKVKSGAEKHPVNNITWFGAILFTSLLNDLEGWDQVIDIETTTVDKNKTGYRLPYEAEWEFSAIGENGNIFPWGNEFDLTKLRSNSTSLINVGSYNYEFNNNCFDMAGNVWEWCIDNYSSRGYFAIRSSDNKVIRGGSFKETESHFFDNSYRNYKNVNSVMDSLGFRVVFQYGSKNE